MFDFMGSSQRLSVSDPVEPVDPADPASRTSAAANPSMRWPRIAVTAVFVVHGLLFASWTAHIPDVKAHLGLTDGTLGFALLGAPVGSVMAMIAASWLLPRVGSRPVVRVALVGYCAAGPLVGLTGSLPALFAALFAWGAFQGTLDVAMNTQAIAVERTGGRILMSGLHGSWSIGAFAGAGIGALAVAAGITLSLQLLVMGTIALLVAGLLTAQMLPAAVEHPGSDSNSDGDSRNSDSNSPELAGRTPRPARSSARAPSARAPRPRAGPAAWSCSARLPSPRCCARGRSPTGAPSTCQGRCARAA